MTLTNIINTLADQNKDKRIIYPDINDDRVFEAITKLVELWETPVICWKTDELYRYQDLISQWLMYFEVPEDEKNEVFAAQKLANGEVDGFLGGNISATPDIAKAIIRNVSRQQWISRGSSHFLMWKDDSLLLFSDAGFQIDPTPEQLAEITLLTVQRAIRYGLQPRVAMLSYSTTGSGWDTPLSLKMREATELAKQKLSENGLSDVPLEWEIQFDAAFVPEVGKRKNPDTTLTESANVFIFPNLDAANIAYKITERLGWYTALWPIFQWFSKPANDLSRGCSVQDIIDMHHITKNM